MKFPIESALRREVSLEENTMPLHCPQVAADGKNKVDIH